jgi:hypothetical protein
MIYSYNIIKCPGIFPLFPALGEGGGGDMVANALSLSPGTDFMVFPAGSWGEAMNVRSYIYENKDGENYFH